MLKIKNSFSTLGEFFLSHVEPAGLASSKLVHINRQLQDLLGLGQLSDEMIHKLTSCEIKPEGYSSLASVYAGHQFGVFVPQLGDGRALLIAEHIAPDGKLWEFQLKGAGKTPYSRMGDGRAVLRSTIREYLASLAMSQLGIATTSALAMVHAPDTPVYREQVETAAIVLRVAPSFIRFGHFEFHANRNQPQQLKQLTDFVIENYYPEIDRSQPEYILAFLDQVVKNTAFMIAAWQSISFVHGVMNTDNMSILGLTIDYGPYSFMDTFRPEHAYNHSDHEARYCYARQPNIGWWNLYRLAEALSLIYNDTDKLELVLAKYAEYFNQRYTQLMAAKLGFIVNEGSSFNLDICNRLLKIMLEYQMDWTYSWHQLSLGEQGISHLAAIYNLGEDFSQWQNDWQDLLVKDNITAEQAFATMKKNNPAFILRNHLLQEAIAAAEIGNYTAVARLFDAASDPYTQKTEFQDLYKLPPTWAAHIELSCSS